MYNRNRSLTFTILTLVIVCLIWGHSLQPVEQSRETSLGIMEIIEEVLPDELAKSPNLHHYIRKAAHLGEFAVLAITSYLAVFFSNYRNRNPIVYLLYFGILIALGDELIQTQVEGRGPQVTDIAIDHVGFILGLISSMMATKRYAYHHKRNPDKTAVHMK